MLSNCRFSILFFAFVIIICSSCNKKTNSEGRYIPRTAAAVILMNGGSLSSKLPWEEIKENPMFKEMYSKAGLDSNMKTILDNPDNTGIDNKKNIVMYMQKDAAGSYLAIEGAVKDGEKFKSFYNSVLKGAAATEKDGVHYLSSSKMTSSWDKEKFVIVIDMPDMNGANRYKNPYETDSSSPGMTKHDLLPIAAQIYSLAEDNSLAKDENFSKLVAAKGDIHFWVNISGMITGNENMASISMLNISKLYENMFVTGVTNFEDGRISIDLKTYAGKELTDLFKKYSDTKLNTEMIKRIPSKDVLFLFALSFKPNGLRDLIKLTGMEGFINVGAAQLGFTLDDFIQANKGDILVAVSELNKKDSAGVSEPNGLFAASIADKTAFGKLIDAGNKLGKQKMGESMKDRLSYNVSDDYFVIGTDKLNTDKFLSTANNSNFSFMDKISGSTSAFYLNTQGLLKAMNEEAKNDSLENLSFQATLKMWESVIATGGGFQDGAANLHIDFNLLDKTTNSLKQLNNYMGTMGSIEKQKKEMRNQLRDNPMYKDTNDVNPAIDSAQVQ